MSAPFFAVACNGIDIQKQSIEYDAVAVSFEGFVSDEYHTKGQDPLQESTLYTMGVFAGYEEEEETFGDESLANDFISNARYVRQFLENPFAGEDVCYWPFAGKLSFFAYAPYVSDSYLQFASDYVSGYPRLSYAPNPDVTEQPDFCIASPVLDRHNNNAPIPLLFHHSLSRIMFAANYAGTLPAISASLYVKVDNIRICNVIGRKTLIMSNGSPCFVWQDDSECPASDRVSYNIDRSPDHQLGEVRLNKATSPVTDNYQDISTANGKMYLLPQSMQYGDAYLEVTYGYYEMVGTTETLRSSVTTSCNLPAVDWEPTHSYRYKFTINLATSSLVNVSVSVEAWKDADNTQSNPIHIE